MKLNLKYLSAVLLGGTLLFSSCTKDQDSPGYEYMPDMYRSQAIEAYIDYGMVGDDERSDYADSLKNTMSARKPVEGTIPFNNDPKMAAIMMPFPYGPMDLDQADREWKIPESYLEDIDGNVKEGKRLFGLFCKHCHGEKGQGDGGVVEVGGFNPPSPYNGAYKNRSLGGIFHVITYGKGAMGSHASQLNKDERWKVAMFVRTLQHGDFNLQGLMGADSIGTAMVDTITQ